MADKDFKDSPYYKDPIKRRSYYGKQFPDGSKSDKELKEEQKYQWNGVSWELKPPDDPTKNLPPDKVIDVDPQQGPQGPNPIRDALLGVQSTPQSNPLTQAFGIQPSPSTTYPAMPGTPDPQAQAGGQFTSVPGLGGPAGPTLPHDLPPNLINQFKTNSVATAAFNGTDYAFLGALHVYAGSGSDYRQTADKNYNIINGPQSATAIMAQYMKDHGIKDQSKMTDDQNKEVSKIIDTAMADVNQRYGELAPDKSGADAHVVTGTQYMDQWFNMDDKTQAKFMQKFVKAGLLTQEQASSNAMGSVSEDMGAKAWAYLIQNASLKWTTAGTKITPEGVLNQFMAKGSKPQDVWRTSTDKSYSVSDGMSANKALSAMLTDRLGRLPTKAEKAAFLSALNAYERSNPSVRTSKTNTITGDSTSTSSGGADSAGFAEDYAQNHNQAEYGAVQGATTYYKAFMDLLSGG